MKILDYLIVGAGPAGLQLAYYLKKSRSNYLVLERANKAGSFFERFPRHRKLISINKVYTGSNDPDVQMRWDWNSLLSDDPTMRLEKHTKEYFPNADKFVEYLAEFAEQYQLNISYNSDVVSIDKQDDMFVVSTANGEKYYAKVVVAGTGIHKPYIPSIPGMELVENYVDCSVDKNDFINKRVLVIGKGNSSFETAEHLIDVALTIHVASPNPLKFAWQTHFVGHLRAVNNNFLDTYQLKSQNAILDANIKKIEMRDGKYYVSFHYSHAKDETEVICYDKVIAATGFRFDNSIFAEGMEPELAVSDRFPRQTHEWESTNIEDLYFIGAVTQQRDYKKHTSAFIHGFRYNVECLAKILLHKYEGKALPKTELDYAGEKITEMLITRINRSSSLWQQFGFLGDLVTVDPETDDVDYFETLPVDYIHESKKWEDKHQFILTLEYGKFGEMENVFAIERDPDSMRAADSKFLHPVIRHYFKGELLSKHHIIEDLEANWTHPENHVAPLNKYLEEELFAIEKPVAVN